MRAVVYSEPGGSDVLRLVERPEPTPGPGEVRVRVHVSGVNPTDWKARRAPRGGALPFPEQVPNQDGAGVIDAVGEGVSRNRLGERVWIWEAAWGRPGGTAQELVVLPERQAVPLPDGASFDLGASLGIPALTACICLTAAADGPRSLRPGALVGRTVLVAGGAGAVGHAAIQLARWAGARVLATVSTEEKAALARAAGADDVVRYRDEDAVATIRRLAPDGVDLVVEVAPAVNGPLDAATVAPNGTVAVYAADGGAGIGTDQWPLMLKNVTYRFVLVYTVPDESKEQAVADVSAALADGALPVGEEAGLPLHRFPLERTAAAHDAVEAGAVGKVLIDVA
ncbi:MAG: NADPH:quinone reductase [Gaiellaceae bacterium]|nr:MAG: NADPH:quinone reductase [Gaiellaceae bacterium]